MTDSPTSRPHPRGHLLACALVLVLGLTPDGATAQGFPGLVEHCAASDPESLSNWCREVALAVQAVQGSAGLAAAGGSDLPGSGSTLGRRLGRMPRISTHASVSVVRAGIPNVLSSGEAPAPESSFFMLAGRFAVNAGVFHGLSLGPTVGGIFAVDLTASVNVLGLPSGEGFDEGVRGLGYGARVGLLRESFTLPGLSISWVHRGFDDIGFGDDSGGSGARIDSDLNVTSVRAVVGKELFGMSLLGGYGWDTYSGDASITARAPGSNAIGTAKARNLESKQTLWFVSGSLNFLLLQLTGEAGWASGYDSIFPDRPFGGYDPSDRTLFGTISLRLTL